MVAASITYGCRWEDEPFSRGVYSHVAVGASSADYDVMAEPPNPDPDPNLNPNPDPNPNPHPKPNSEQVDAAFPAKTNTEFVQVPSPTLV